MSKRDTLTVMQAITSLRDHLDNRLDAVSAQVNARLDAMTARIDYLADQIVGLKIDQHHHRDD